MKKIKRPSVVSTIFQSYLRSFWKPTPIWIHYFITRKCNFNCQYCGAKDNRRPDPSFTDVCKTILKIKSLGCNTIGFMGGEPTIRKDFPAIVKFCSQHNIYSQVSTNCSLLLRRESNGKTLLDNLVAAGLGTINVSIDSVINNYEISEKMLFKNTAVLESLIRAKNKHGLRIILVSVVTKQNIKQIPQIVEFCHNKKITLTTPFVQNPKPFDSKIKSQLKKVLFTKKDKDKVINLVDYLIKKKNSGYQIVDPLSYYQSIKKWIDNKLSWRCEGGKYFMQVDTDGSIGICGYIPFLKLNIHEVADYYQQIKGIRNKYLQSCTRNCIPSCWYNSSHYYRHPGEFIVNYLRYGNR